MYLSDLNITWYIHASGYNFYVLVKDNKNKLLCIEEKADEYTCAKCNCQAVRTSEKI